MKNFGRKMLGLILAITMVCSILPMAVMATPTTSGYALKFEYADNTAAQGFPQVRENDVFSGGTANQTVTGSSAYYITFTADIAKAGDYTIWIRGGRHGQSYVSPIQITVDGTTVLPELANDTGSFWANSYGINHQMAFQSTTATFTAGSHTIKYELTDIAPGSSYWLGAFDCMIIMPTNYTWTPAIDTMPTAPTLKEFDEDGYGWFEETDVSKMGGYFNQDLSNAAYSGGSALGVNQADYADNYLDFYINVPKAGTYDIWVYGTSTNSWASAPKLLLNGVEQTLTSMSGEKWNGSFVTQWKKVSGLSLTAGEVDISYLLNVSRAGGATNYIGVFDVMCIVPSGWGWSWTDANTAPTKPTKPSPIDFHEDGYAWLEDSDFSVQKGFVERTVANTSSEAEKFSASHARTLAENNAPGAEGYYMDYYLNVPKTDTYDIWVRGADPDYGYNSAAKLLIDGVERTTTPVGSETWFLWESNWRLKWVKATVQLTEGSCELRYLIDTIRPAGTYYYGALDMICIVPSSWGWTQSITNKPVKPALKQFHEDGYGWFEETDYSVKHGYFNQNISHASYSGGSALAVNQADYADNYLDFYINVPKADTYDIWVNGTSTNNWASAPKLLIDGVEQTLTSMSGELWNSSFVSQWKKVSAVTLTEGEVDIRYLLNVSRAGGSTQYIGLFDAICIVPTSWGWSWTNKDAAPTKPVKPTYVSNAWIEGENVSGSNTPSGQRSMDAYHGGKAQVVSTASAPGVNGYYFDYSVLLQAGTYDIYFRGSDDSFSEWMSNATAYVDGTEKSYTSVLSEGWDASGGFAYGWLKVSGVELTKDAHTIRWAYKESRTAGATTYIGDLDCIAIVPSGTQFTPVKNNNTNTKIDYNISLLLSAYNLSNISENLILPATLENGSAVTWSSNNTDVIANDGTFTKPYGNDLVVNLTATAEGYSKVFNITVFAIPVYSRSAWIEGEDDLLSGSYTANGTRNLECYSGGKAQFVNTNAIPGADGYFFDHIVNLQAGTYDIYFRGSDDSFSEWMSNATAYVDGTEKSYTSVLSEGWDASGGFAYGWLKISGVELTKDAHTIRWAYKESRTAGATAYIGDLDCIAIVPSGTPFTPVKNDNAATKADFYNSLVLANYDLANITENITLPTSLSNGTVVAWASSKPGIISNNGTVTRPVGDDVVVNLTASFGTTEKVFAVTVKGLEKYEITDFAIGGSCTAGGTVTATVNVQCNGDETGQASLILAVYRDDGKLGDMIATDIQEKVISSTSTTFNCSVAIDAGQEGTLFARAFLWNDFSDLKPLVDGI